MTSHRQIDFEAVLIFIDFAHLHFCLALKNSYRVIKCHTTVILQLGEEKLAVY